MDEAARAVEESGIRASLSIGMGSLDGKGDEKLARSAEFCEKWHGAAGEELRRCSVRMLLILARAASFLRWPSALPDLGVGVHIHISETEREVSDSRKAVLG